MSTKSLEMKVPSIVCQGCADAIREVIKTADSEAKVSVDVDRKTVDVETTMSVSSVRQAIASINHQVES